MKQSMIVIKLNEMAEKKGRSLYWVAKNSGVPYVTLWNLSQRQTQNSINLPVLSRLCTTLECKPGDLLEHVTDAEDAAITALVKAKDGIEKAAKKKGARAK